MTHTPDTSVNSQENDSAREDKSFSDASTLNLFDNIPEEIRRLPRWVMWKEVPVTRKDGTTHMTKKPLQTNGHAASSTDEATWCTFEDAVKALETGQFSGIGWTFKFPYVGFDQDHIIEEDGTINSAARHNLDVLRSYSEISPSGAGTHTIIKGTKPGKECKREPYEMYDRARFFTMTGRIIKEYGTEVTTDSEAIKTVYKACIESSQEEEERPKKAVHKVKELTDKEIIEKAFKAANGAKFKELYAGGLDSYPSPSEGDQAFCDMLAFWTKDSAKIERIFQGSGRAREKTDRPDYMRRTIKAALGRVKTQYGEDPKTEKPEHIDPETNPETKNRANEIMENGDPVKFILDTYNKLHAGDRELGLAILCGMACQSTTSSEGLHPAINGPSSGGKSHAAKMMIHLVPETWKLVASISAKAIFYNPNLASGTVVFIDDIEMSDDLKSTIKRCTTFYQKGVVHQIAGKNHTLETFQTPPRMMWIMTSVNSDYGEEINNRMVALDVCTTNEQRNQIIAFQKTRALSGNPDLLEDDDVWTCREIIGQVKSQLFKVIIPFADRIEWRDRENSRNLDIFFDMVRALAVLRFKQRIRDGDILEATEEDFEDAKRLYRHISVKQTTKLTESERKLATLIHQRPDGITNVEMSMAMGKSSTAIRNMLHGKDGNGGLFAKVVGIERQNINTLREEEGQSRQMTIYKITKFDSLAEFMDVVDLKTPEKTIMEE